MILDWALIILGILFLIMMGLMFAQLFKKKKK